MGNGNKNEYPLELAAERLLNAIRRFFFEIPKNKMDKIIYIIETVSWLMLGTALILRILGK